MINMAINDINRFHLVAEKTLEHLGVSKSPISYEYILDILDVILCDGECVNLQPIYLQVAYERGKDWKAVRRSVRRAISTAYLRNKNNGWWNYVFGDINTVPDDSRFIRTVYRHILSY